MKVKTMKKMQIRNWGLMLLILAIGFGLLGCAASDNGGAGSSQNSVTASPKASASQATAEPSAPSSASPTASSSDETGKTGQADKGGDVKPSPSSSPAEPSSSPKPSNSPKPPDNAAPAVDNVTLSIVGNAKWGTILAEDTLILSKGDTPASVLKRAAKAHRLAYSIRGSGALTYVAGIDGLFEFDDGPTSGWKFRVNGIVADVGSGAYKLKAGDRLEWYYVTEDDAAQDEKESAS
ncbi:DUF4430 domain-containing protein [Cohnella endophytica]|uniref:DUF4430 domain-containing protein n=1 Tax=Cohnella endophytica TaxID=2419778 RepID=A0A494X069_9BACL|nr:DUF4430 domain-containing protein [Cohnella endophytica]RKP44097.1 DUF4430 domain-containing protein [Cohnella endophytica]